MHDRAAVPRMSLPLICGAIWVLAAALVSLIPMPAQKAPGLVLLIAALPLILWIGATEGWVWAGLAVFALVSMFRRPLAYLWRRLTGASA